MSAGKYRFKTEPYAHQRLALTYRDAWRAPEFAWLMEMGTGKSKVAIDNLGILYERGLLDGLLVVAPKTVVRNWSDREVPAHLPDRIARRVLVWRAPSDRTVKFYRAWDDLLRTPDLAVLVMNVEALSARPGQDAAAGFLGARSAMFVLDESTAIKNPRAKRTKTAIALARLARYRRIMTGAPMTRDPLDFWSQFEFLRPGCLGDSSFWSFRSRYARVVRRQVHGRAFEQVVGFHDLDRLAGIVGQHAYRVTKAECLDLPPKVYQTREVELTPEQLGPYEEMERDFRALVGGGEATAQIVLTKLMRLHQIACGWLPLDDGTVAELPSNRQAALLDALEEAGGQAVVWCSYRHDVRRVASLLRERHGPGAAVELHGEVDPDDRQRAVEAFQSGAARFLVGTPRTGGLGITLTAASTVVYYSNTWDLEARMQSEDRAHRIGQVRSVTYVDLVTPGTVDELIVKTLARKAELAALVAITSPAELLAMVPRCR